MVPIGVVLFGPVVPCGCFGPVVPIGSGASSLVPAGAKNFDFSTFQGEKTSYFPLTREVATHFPPSYATGARGCNPYR